MINYTAIASDAEVARTTVPDHYQILEDTLIGFRLPAWKKAKARKAIGKEKFYFFDSGAVNALVGRKSVALKTPESGILFETFLLNEVRAYLSYCGKDATLNYWQSKSGFEVDLIANDELAIEFKAKATISAKDLRSLEATGEERTIKTRTCVYAGKTVLQINGMEVLPHLFWLKKLWADEIL